MGTDICGIKLLKGRNLLFLEEHAEKPADHVILGGTGGEGCEFFFGPFPGRNERGPKGLENENITERSGI
jgi:hypothetical protein